MMRNEHQGAFLREFEHLQANESKFFSKQLMLAMLCQRQRMQCHGVYKMMVRNTSAEKGRSADVALQVSHAAINWIRLDHLCVGEVAFRMMISESKAGGDGGE